MKNVDFGAYKEKLKKMERKTIFPQKLNIETTNFCNLKCPMCPRVSMSRPLEHMDFIIFKKIVDEAAKFDIKGVWLHVFGEPLLHPQLFEFIQYIKKYKAIKNVGISTNCALLSEEKANEILSAGLDRIILSLDAASGETYSKIRGDDFEIATTNVNNFLKLKKERKANIKVQVSIIDMVYNHNEIQKFQATWKNLLAGNDEILIKPYVNFGNQVEDLRFNNKGNAHIRRPCKKLWNSLTILSNGNVVGCCYDVNGVLYLGNVNKEPLVSIWQGQGLRKLRQIHWAGDIGLIPLCSDCSAVSWYE